MFSYVSLEQRVPQNHLLRVVRKLTDAVLWTLSPVLNTMTDGFACIVRRRTVVRELVQFGETAYCLCLLIGWSGRLSGAAPALGQQPLQLTSHWDKVTVVSNTTPTLQVVVNPPLRPRGPLSVASYEALKDLGADYVRYVPSLPYPKLAVAELEPPAAEKTSWDFSLIDPMTKDSLAATDGHSTILNFSKIPVWLFKTDQPVTYPNDPNQVDWDYTQGTELRDPSGKELGDDYARL